MERNQRLPLLIVEFRGVVTITLLAIDLYAFSLNHDKSGVYPLGLGDELLLGDGASFGLFD